MDPLIFDIGSRPAGWHGVMMVTGIIVAVLLSVRFASKSGISPQAVYTSAFWIVLFGLIGSRLSHVIDDFDYYSDHLSQIPAIWEGGMGWYGGLLGGMIGVIVYTKLEKIPLGKFFDAIAIGGVLGLAVGRLGCTINGDAYGTPTSLPWGLIYTHPDDFADLFVKGHPAPVYEIIWIFGIAITLWALSGKKIPHIWLGALGLSVVLIFNLVVSDSVWTQTWISMLGITVVGVLIIITYTVLSRLKRLLIPPGSLFLATVAMYSFGRFFISWVREEPTVLGPLHQSHLFSIILFAVCVAFLIYRKAHLVTNEGASVALIDNDAEIEK